MTQDEKLLQAVIAERGFLVMNTDAPGLKAGFVLDRPLCFDVRSVVSRQAFVVLSPTDRKDADQHLAAISRHGAVSPRFSWDRPYFYRIGTD